MEQNGTEWNRMEQNGTEWNRMEQNGTEQKQLGCVRKCPLSCITRLGLYHAHQQRGSYYVAEQKASTDQGEYYKKRCKLSGKDRISQATFPHLSALASPPLSSAIVSF
jgi:hypothetical protein